MRTVFPRRMVAHLWAHQNQDEARTKRGNFYFRGAVIYSYGSHFPIARHVRNKQGAQAVLLTTRGYSVTTAGHKRLASVAANHLTMFQVDNVMETDHRANLKDYQERINQAKRGYVRARTRKDWALMDIERLTNEANDYAEYFGLKTRFAMPEDLEAMQAECLEIDRKESERKRKQREKAEREKRQALQDWVDGKHDGRGWFHNSPVRMRINGDKVETSLGAEFPLDHAIKAFWILKAIRERGDSWRRNGEEIRLGHFRVDSIDGHGVVKAGCHTVEWAEIERVAALAGVL